MKIQLRTLLLATALTLPGLAPAQTTISLTNTATNYATGALDPASAVSGVTNSGVATVGSSFSHSGTTANGITPQTIGQSFTATANGSNTQAGTAALLYTGSYGGSTITGGTVVPIHYDFTVGKNAGITSAVTWSLYFDGDGNGTNLPNTLLASGTVPYVFGNTSATFVNTVNYTYSSAVNAGDTYRTYLEVAFTTNTAASQGVLTVTMNDTGYGGQGITIGSAIPEPSTYAALAGLAALGLAGWHRQRRRTATAA